MPEFYSKYASITHGMLINKVMIMIFGIIGLFLVNGQITGYLSFRLVPVETHVDKTTRYDSIRNGISDEETLGQF